MRKTLFSTFTAAVILMSASSALSAQTVTSSGTFTVTATIDPSISLSFASDTSGLALASGNGTNTATLAFGHVAAYGYTAPTGVTQSVNGTAGNATSFNISTPFDVLVMKANSTSSSYTLTAALNSADTTNTWTIDSKTVTSDPTSITSSGTYDSAASHTLQVTIPFTNTTGSISNAVNFVATAN